MPNLTYRVYPGSSASSAVVANGRTFSNTLAFADLPYADAAILAANGWMNAGRVGTTAQRPTGSATEPTPAKPNEHYVDTTLGKVVVFDGAQWRDPLTGGVV